MTQGVGTIKANPKILLVDDDQDDCIFFQEALSELPFPSTLTIVQDSALLLKELHADLNNLPDLLFLDLNMPKRYGTECLTDIKTDHRLRDIPVIMFSTSYIPEIIDQLYEHGANYYLRKPGEFSKLKSLISKAVNLIFEQNYFRPVKENFVLV